MNGYGQLLTAPFFFLGPALSIRCSCKVGSLRYFGSLYLATLAQCEYAPSGNEFPFSSAGARFFFFGCFDAVISIALGDISGL